MWNEEIKDLFNISNKNIGTYNRKKIRKKIESIL